jgi:hypothetical protein
MSTQWYLFLVLVGLSLLDVVTTAVGLAMGAQELNPLYDLLGGGLLGIIAVKVAVLGFLAYLLRQPTPGWFNAGMVLVIGWTAIVVGSNFGFLAHLVGA